MTDERLKEIMADGAFDAEEVKEVREDHYDDNEIERFEVEQTVKLITGCSTVDNSAQQLLKDELKSWLLEDENSPNEIDDEEVEALIAVCKPHKDNNYVKNAVQFVYDMSENKPVKVKAQLLS